MIQSERIEALNTTPPRAGKYVLYWMQQAQRTEFNHALEFTVREANRLDVPPVVLFALTDSFPEANARHYAFMMEGLRDVGQALARRGILFLVRHAAPEHAVLELAGDACLVVTDRGYLEVQMKWRRHVARKAPCAVIQVETDVLVPVEVVADKEEYAARTIRPKVHKHLRAYLAPLRPVPVRHKSAALPLRSLSLDDPAVLRQLKIDRTVAPVHAFAGGTAHAKKLLGKFIRGKLEHYDDLRNDPGLDYVSHMSPYLHFGQIAPLYIALEVSRAAASQKSKDAYLEELIVRRELSMNFVQYNRDYATYDAVPEWAQRTLAKHGRDRREHLYTRAQLEAAETHDPFWNAAQIEMAVTGKMHNYMRMYWGKKIIEWSESPEEAFAAALHLNNKYELDGRDPNSFAGVAWCFGKHDRPWTERPIFGTVRFMNDAGLRRKFDMEKYVRQVEGLSERKIL
ncbi:MAG: deoxyribodipyrimidine photo-lyase [Kiritimatiellae bacterium]|nr:deoxyribodipyrimidine photo-lyase [Kiritimatiellia bacterium]